MLRGGSWFDDARNVRCAIRFAHVPGHRNVIYGFHPVASANEKGHNMPDPSLPSTDPGDVLQEIVRIKNELTDALMQRKEQERMAKINRKRLIVLEILRLAKEIPPPSSVLEDILGIASDAQSDGIDVHPHPIFGLWRAEGNGVISPHPLPPAWQTWLGSIFPSHSRQVPR